MVPIAPVEAASFGGHWPEEPEDLSQGESLSFVAVRMAVGRDHRFVVTWRREPGAERLTQRIRCPLSRRGTRLCRA